MPMFVPPIPPASAFSAIITPPGLFVPIQPLGQVTGTVLFGGDDIALLPFFPVRSFNADQIVARVQVANVGDQARFLVYDVNGDGTPNSLVFESPIVDTSAAGPVTAAMDLTFEAFHQYWIGMHFKLAGQYAEGSTGALRLPKNSADFFSSSIAIYRTVVPFAGGAPSPWGFVAAESGAYSAPYMYLRVAA